MQAITIYCGANTGSHPDYRQAAEDLGKYMAQNHYTVVYGGGSVGLMGVVADAALAHGGEVIGVIPHFLDRMEVGHKHLTEMIKVETMHARKAIMEHQSDAFITLPGGYGSLDEVFEILTWSQLGLHEKPIGLYNVRGYYNLLIQQLDHMVAEGFLRPENRALLVVGDTLDELFQQLASYAPDRRTKWMDTSGI